jgi:hydrogenase expression/formation protein HypD
MEQEVLSRIHKLARQIDRDVNLMEVCGTHTQAVARAGIKSLLPENIHLTTGPGCPVCVTAQEDIDAIVSLALAGIPIATYGDMMRVPGSFGSLDQAREKGAKVFDVYSVEEAVKIDSHFRSSSLSDELTSESNDKNDKEELVFFGLGFETTAPMTAYAIRKGLTVYSTHKLFLPAMKALLEIGKLNIDGYICPGHVSAIIGTRPYKDMQVPQVITGFKPDDILVGTYMLLRQLTENRTEVENEYKRVVRDEGNPKALKEIFEVFETGNGNWRGFGIIPGSGLEIKKKYEAQNAKVKHKEILDKIDFSKSRNPTACKCGEIIRGLKNPADCPIYKKRCTPDKPVGPCMVSIEGACNVEYRYGNLSHVIPD